MKQVKITSALLLIGLWSIAQTVTPNPGPYQNTSTKYQYTWQKWSGGLWNLGKLVQEDSAYFKGITYVPTALDADSNTRAANTAWVRKWVADNVSPGVPGVPLPSWQYKGNYSDAWPTNGRLGFIDSFPLKFITNNQIRLIIPDNGVKRNYGLANKFLVIDTATKELYYMDGGSGGSSVTVTSYSKNATLDSTILLLSDGTRYAAKDSVGGGGGGLYVGSGLGYQNDSTIYIPDSIRNDLKITTRGIVINSNLKDTLNSSLYTDVSPNSTFTFTSNGVTTSGGNNDNLNYIEYSNYWTNAANYERSIDFKSTVAGNGIGIGINNTNGKIIGRIILTGANSGKLLIDTYRNSTTTNRITSTSALTFSTTDSIRLIFKRQFYNYRLTAINITTGQIISVENTDPLNFATIQFSAWNAGKSAIFHYGGEQLITRDVYTINEKLNPKLLIYGNSIAAGAYAGAGENMFYSILKPLINGDVALIAGGGNLSNDYFKLRSEIFSLKPSVILWTDGVNDLVSGQIDSAKSSILLFINDCYNNNVIPIICTVLPVGASVVGTGTNLQLRTDINTLNTWIAALGNVQVIDTYTALVSGGFLNASYDYGDGLHLNAAGNTQYAKTVYEAITNPLSNGALKYINANANASHVLTIKNSNTGALSTTGLQLISGTGAAGTYLTTYSDIYAVTGGGEPRASKTILANFGNGANGGLAFQAITSGTGISFTAGSNDIVNKTLNLQSTLATLTVPVISTQYRLSALNTAPASATATGTLGEIRITATYIYVCVATNTWVRAALATW